MDNKLSFENEINLPWVEKYRPVKIDDIISHTKIIELIKNFISNKSLPNLLFHGPPGCGKTSMIMACANEIYGNDIGIMTLRLNASDDRGIEKIRTDIKQFVMADTYSYTKKFGKEMYKLVILDETDSMTLDAQEMLKQLIDILDSKTKFCLICNYLDKINILLQSRCTNFRFSPLKRDDMKKKIIKIATEQNVLIEPNAIDSILNISNGDMRIAINTLQQVSSKKSLIKSNDIYKIASSCTTKILKILKDELININMEIFNFQTKLDLLNEIIDKNNISIPFLLDGIKNLIMVSEFNNNKKIKIIKSLSKLEIYNSRSINQKLIIMSLISIFIENSL